MRLLLIHLLATTVALTAQSPLSTIFASNSGAGFGSMVFFDLDVTTPAGVQIFQMNINTHTAAGGIQVYTVPTTWVGNEANAAAWSLAGSATFTSSSGTTMPTPCCFGSGFFLPMGQYGIAIAANVGTDLHYSNAGAQVPQIYSTTELTLTAGASSGSHFTGAPFNPRVWNGDIFYNVGPVAGTCIPNSAKEVYGVGCTDGPFASFYEVMASAANDLSGMKVDAVNTGVGYVVTASAGSSTFDATGMTSLVPVDDGAQAVGTLGLTVGSNGWVARGAGNSTSFLPLANTMLGNPSEAIYAWTDLQPNATGSGLVYYEETGMSARVLFDNVYGWSTTNPNQVEIFWDLATGNFSIEFGVVGLSNPEDWLVGYSPAGSNANPGEADLSTTGTTPLITATTDVVAMALDSNTPTLGGNWDLTTTNIDPISPFSITFFGDRGAAVPFVAIGLGAPGCDINLASIIGNLTATNVGGSSIVTVGVPNSPALAGGMLAAQSISLTLSNAAGLLSSNGVEGVFGN